jgi:hypothetical protein
VWNAAAEEVDRIEITSPCDGAAEAEESRLVVDRGYGHLHEETPEEELDALVPHVMEACRKKAQKDYSGCTLVVAICLNLFFDSLADRSEKQIKALVGEIACMKFKAKRVFLIVLPDRVFDVGA